MVGRTRFGLAVFLSAFLLFQIQPLIARFILPWFGGGAAVWATTLLFFQLVLLIGYAYAYGVSKWLSLERQAIVHLVLLGVSLILLPVAPGADWKPDGGADPTLRILALLASTVGLPCLLASTTSPLLQSWFGRTRTHSPYRLYAVSNLGSFLGLLTYPFLVEPLLGLDSQALMWSIGYGLFVAGSAWCAIAVLLHKPEVGGSSTRIDDVDDQPPRRYDRPLWLVLSALGVILLLATTNELTKNISPLPLLWVVPLGLYLCTYILCFANTRWYHRRIWVAVFAIAVIPTLWLPLTWKAIGLPTLVIVCSGTLFAGCMVCHGELARLKPATRHITGFYLTIATGGVLGGAFVSVLAPNLFTRFWEYPVGLIGTFLVCGVCLGRDPIGARPGRSAPVGGRIAFVVIWALVGAGLFYLSAVPMRTEDYIVSERNAYGRVSVAESVRDGQRVRTMVHGRIRHGSQIMDADRRRDATMYFRAASGIGTAVQHHAHPDGLDMGIIGLGTGTLAAYGEAGDTLRFYELNPAVERIAREYFYYLADTPASYEVVLGDARISLERELRETGPHGFDILVVDAFSSDAIPVHLLTREAFELYFEHLGPNGVLALHVTNTYLDLSPVVRNLATDMSKAAILIETEPSEHEPAESQWVLVSSDRAFIDHPDVVATVTPWQSDPGDLVWTDDYSNLLRVLR
jgi:hypothetical protein